MASKPPDAFLSYSRFDDEYQHGAISEFRQQLCMAVQAVTGERFELFQDVDGIGLGERWLGKLGRMLESIHFFIPILTPNYFKSEACRDELQKFLKAEEAARRDDLILPIYYIRCPVLEDERLRVSDPLARVIYQRQWWEWRELRHHSFRTRKVRLAIEQLAIAIEKARDRGQPKPAGRDAPVLKTPVDSDWSRVQSQLRKEFGATAYSTWLAPLTLKGVEDDRVLLEVPTRFLRDWVAAHYTDRIRVLWRRVNPEIRDLTLTVAPAETVAPADPRL